MFDSYKSEVLSAYEKMKSEGNISPNLVEPTPGKLRNECLIVYHERYNTKDDETLRLFFNWKDKDYLKGIENYKIDGFKQLIKALNGEEINVGSRYIELLAWLINFQPRPYHIKIKDAYEVSTLLKPVVEKRKEDIVIGKLPEPSPKEIVEQQEVIEGKQNGDELSEIANEPNEESSILLNEKPLVKGIFGAPKKFNRTIMAFAAALVVLVGLYIVHITTDKQCMYWTGSHYVCVTCDTKIPFATIVALDTFKLEHFKKITMPDTLTVNSIGKVYYSKIDNQVDFYTYYGNHPTISNKILLPMSEYIFNKYVLHHK